VRRDEVGVEVDESLTQRDVIAHLHPGAEALALEVKGVEPDVHQHVEALSRPQGQRVIRRVQRDDDALARCDEGLARGVDGNAVPGELLRKHRVGNAFQRDDATGQRRVQGQPPRIAEPFHRSSPFASCTQGTRDRKVAQHRTASAE
jgi:hypothetical protein